MRSDAETSAEAIEYRALCSAADYAACVELQRLTWGPDYHELVPVTMLKITQRIGGVLFGAFGAHSELIGFVYGVTGVADGRLVHWSHMLAVRAEHRNRGIGQRLKRHQRALLEGLGVAVIQWTFDPLVARNAHFNLVRLGTSVIDYVPDMYGDTGSALHVYGTDRFIVSWSTNSGRSSPIVQLSDADLTSWPLINAPPGEPMPMQRDALGAPRVRIEIPSDIEAVSRDSLELARAWRMTSRAALLGALARGYRPHGFVRAPDDRCYYLLARDAS
jgi:chorismate synthase